MNLTELELQNLIEQAAKKGAEEALKKVGLSDEKRITTCVSCECCSTHGEVLRRQLVKPYCSSRLPHFYQLSLQLYGCRKKISEDKWRSLS